jgi:hypothetical protein
MLDFVYVDKAEIRFVDEGGGLESLAGRLAGELLKKSRISRFHVDSADCRSTKKCCEIKGLNKRINTISL